MYLKGINSLRFFAAMLVVIYHCNDGLRTAGAEFVYPFPIFLKGPFAVDLFFVISGFLLTYLALGEIKKHGILNWKRFYVRRILRIFPLYYLGVFLGFFVIGVVYPLVIGSLYFDFPISEVVWYYLAFLPNYPIVRWENIGPMYSLWSIGVEEQFYLMFPFVILLMTRLKRALLISFLGFSLYSLFFYLVVYGQVQMLPWVKRLIIETLRFHFLFLGVFFGSVFFYFRDNGFFRFIARRAIQLVIYLSFLSLLFLMLPNHPIHNMAGAILFSFILINGAREESMINLEKRQLSFLGMISYGIYIFHPYVSLVFRYLMEKVSGFRVLLLHSPIIFHILVSIISILVAALSYKYYESLFLRLKSRYK